MKNRILSIIVSILLGAIVLSGCKNSESANNSNDNGAVLGASKDGVAKDLKSISIVCTNFPEYDFAKQITGDKGDVTLLLKPGAESHTFEPTPQDIIKIQNCDLFVYVGGDSDEWVDGVLESMDTSKMTVFKLMDQVDLVEEELVEGMEEEKEDDDSEKDADSHEEKEQDEGENEEVENDEHVWTSPANSMTIVKNMCDAIVSIDKDNADQYRQNAEGYIKKIKNIDDQFKDVIKNAKRKEIIVGDRFPFRYFCDEFGLKYYAAFPGCSTDTQPSAKTIAFLIDKVKSDKIPVVFHIELSTSGEQMSKAIAEETGAKVLLLNAVHNVSQQDMDNGATYVTLMQENVESLKEALN
ncbi:metal ABC transporter substrate-binding protein [Butyrivibrio sp. NC3005]|uniref:metal ABC transporter substrate-binding protein n=1 Tax=Butyrivibrio sp. NC3005 TaxID=1280685 RepID=UPI00041770F2|nr:metal ABC transporter substrate-binding protein [Butyrivibrio sp. NC3005]